MCARVRKRRIAPAAMRTEPMLVTDDGMVTELRLEQPLNAYCARTAADARRRARQRVARVHGAAAVLPHVLALFRARVAGGARVWGPLMRMRDELREVAPGVLLGLGSMGATGAADACISMILSTNSRANTVGDRAARCGL